MHKIKTLFLSWDIEKSSLIALQCSDARSHGQSRHRANLVILRDQNSVLILRITQVAVFFIWPGPMVVLYLIRILSAIYSHSSDYSSYFAIIYRLLVNNLLPNSE